MVRKENARRRWRGRGDRKLELIRFGAHRRPAIAENNSVRVRRIALQCSRRIVLDGRDCSRLLDHRGDQDAVEGKRNGICVHLGRAVSQRQLHGDIRINTSIAVGRNGTFEDGGLHIH